MHQRGWMRQLHLFYKVFHDKVPKYIHSPISSMRISAKQPSTFSEWNKLDTDKRSCLSNNSFCEALLNFIRPSENNSTFMTKLAKNYSPG